MLWASPRYYKAYTFILKKYVFEIFSSVQSLSPVQLFVTPFILFLILI